MRMNKELLKASIIEKLAAFKIPRGMSGVTSRGSAEASKIAKAIMSRRKAMTPSAKQNFSRYWTGMRSAATPERVLQQSTHPLDRRMFGI